MNMKLKDIEKILENFKELDKSFLEKKYEPSEEERILMYNECSCGVL